MRTNPCKSSPTAQRVQGPRAFGANEATCPTCIPDILPEFQRRLPTRPHKHLIAFQHKILPGLKKVARYRHRTLPLKSPNLQMKASIRSLALHGHTPDTLRKRSHARAKRSAVRLPLIFPAEMATRARCSINFPTIRSRCRSPWTFPHRLLRPSSAAEGISIISESLARDQVKPGSEAYECRRCRPVAEPRSGLPSRPQPAARRSGPHPMIRERRKPVEAAR